MWCSSSHQGNLADNSSEPAYSQSVACRSLVGFEAQTPAGRPQQQPRLAGVVPSRAQGSHKPAGFHRGKPVQVEQAQSVALAGAQAPYSQQVQEPQEQLDTSLIDPRTKLAGESNRGAAVPPGSPPVAADPPPEPERGRKSPALLLLGKPTLSGRVKRARGRALLFFARST